MTTYLAITRTGPRQGWRVLAYGHGRNKRQAVEAKARALIAAHGDDIYTQAEHRNLHIVSATVARRVYEIDIAAEDSPLRYSSAVRVWPGGDHATQDNALRLAEDAGRKGQVGCQLTQT